MHINTQLQVPEGIGRIHKECERKLVSKNISLVSKYVMMEKEEPALTVSLSIQE